MGAPTQNDFNAFYAESVETKINVLYNYLCRGGYNMQDIARDILFDYNEQASQRVSVITRCYGFEGNNSGRFRSMDVSREDVAAFVNRYPRGCMYDGKGTEMKKFLEQKIQARLEKEMKRQEWINQHNRGGHQSQVGQQLQGRQKPSLGNVYSSARQTFSQGNNQHLNWQSGGRDDPNSDKQRSEDDLMFRVMAVFWGILFMFFKFFLGWKFLISLILACFLGSVLAALVFKDRLDGH